jgi:hypothetical protein
MTSRFMTGVQEIGFFLALGSLGKDYTPVGFLFGLVCHDAFH